MKPPILEQGKCSLAIAKFDTGHILKKDLTFFLNGENELDIFQIFDDFTDAKEFVNRFIKCNPEFEGTIYNFRGECIATVDLNGERKLGNSH